MRPSWQTSSLADCCGFLVAPSGILCLSLNLVLSTLGPAVQFNPFPGPGPWPLALVPTLLAHSLALCPSGGLEAQALTSCKVLGKGISLWAVRVLSLVLVTRPHVCSV